MKAKMFFCNFIITLLFAYTLAFYEESKFVVELDVDNFEEMVLDKNDIWLIQFFGTQDNDCLEYADTYENVAKALKGFIKVGAVDIDKARLIAYRYNVIKLPTIILIKVDKKFIEIKDKRRENDLIKYAEEMIAEQMNENLKEKYIDLPFVSKVTEDDLEKQVKQSGRWIIAYYNQDVAADANFKSFFTTLATKLQDNIKFGYYEINGSNTIQLNRMPTIVYYFGKKSDRNEVEYSETLENVDDAVTWALNNIKRPEILELRSETLLRDACVNKKYCIICLISNTAICDRNCKSDIKSSLQNLAERYKHYSASWAIVRKSSMPILEDIFSITRRSNLPALLVVNVKSLKSRELENFDDETGSEFLNDVFYGNGFAENRLPGFDNLLLDHYNPWHDEL